MSLAATLGLASYRLAGYLAGPLARRKIRQRIREGKEDPRRVEERFGIASETRPDGPLVWLHGASVGESLAGLILIDAIGRERPDLRFLVTTGTVTSANLLAERLPACAMHQYVPLDLPGAVARFVDHWRPNLALWLESEFWPNMLAALDRHAIPRVLVNGRVSSASYNRWSSLRPVIARLLEGFKVCLAQTDEDAQRLQSLGARHVLVTGSLKESAPPLPADDEAVRFLSDILGDRPRWVAASTHAGEEEVALAVHRNLTKSLPGLITFVVPRHPERGAEVAAIGRDMGLRVSRRAEGQLPAADCDVYVADTMGEMGLWYRLASVVFVGKSLAGSGGQNPWEPAVLNSAVLFGPDMTNFQEAADGLVSAGAARRVVDEDSLTEGVRDLLTDARQLQEMQAAGRDFISKRRGTLEATLTALSQELAGLG